MNIPMKVAIMQPYMFPYIGYFQLINAVDKFVFYDDVNFIKRGWINRNKIAINNEEKLISFPCLKVSQNKLIKDVKVNTKDKSYCKILSTIKMAYYNAPNFSTIFPIIESILNSNPENIAELASLSIIRISEYLGLNIEFYYSTKLSPETINMNREDRLINITKTLNSNIYINLIGGKELYDKKYFSEYGVSLYFLEPSLEPYQQFNNEFISGLSIIDILMFNSVDEVNNMLQIYRLV